jgi:hypothetical protein
MRDFMFPKGEQVSHVAEKKVKSDEKIRGAGLTI